MHACMLRGMHVRLCCSNAGGVLHWWLGWVQARDVMPPTWTAQPERHLPCQTLPFGLPHRHTDTRAPARAHIYTHITPNYCRPPPQTRRALQPSWWKLREAALLALGGCGAAGDEEALQLLGGAHGAVLRGRVQALVDDVLQRDLQVSEGPLGACV